jgi:hypothetical protein
MPPYTLAQTAKTWIATGGVAATALLGLIAGDSTAGKILTIVAAVGTAAATYAVPNAPMADAAAETATFDPQ